MTPAKISNIIITRNPFLNKNEPKEVTSEFGNYDFRGVRMIIYHTGTPFIVPHFK